MNKRYIGLDIGVRRTLMVVLEYAKDESVNVYYQETHQSTLEEQLSELRKDIDGDFHAADRVIAALPARKAFVRDLEFPFRGTRKIMAAMPLALNIQIPIPVESCATASYIVARDKGLTKVKAAAVPSEALNEVLAVAQQVQMPVHVVDLSPFGYIAGLTQQLNDALLILSDDQETTVSLVYAGELVDYRLIPGGANLLNEDKAVVVEREIKALLRNAGERRELPIYLAGEAGHDDLIRLLREQQLDAQELLLDIAGEDIPAAFAPAAALALRMTSASKEGKSFNFRSGEFGIAGEWQKFRKPLLCSLGLLLIAVILLTLTAVTLLQNKDDQIDVLETQIRSLYQETFPEATVIVDAPKQMAAALRELQEQNALLGHAQVGVLPLLKAVSDLPVALNVVLQELSYSATEVRLVGSTDSFEQVNQLTELLATSDLFADVRVADAKMSVQGDKVNFRLLLTFSGVGRVAL
jgi:general secretion pathway protein L